MFRVYSFIVLIVPLYVFTGGCQCSNWTLLSCSLLHVHVSVLLNFIEQIKWWWYWRSCRQQENVISAPRGETVVLSGHRRTSRPFLVPVAVQVRWTSPDISHSCPCCQTNCSSLLSSSPWDPPPPPSLLVAPPLVVALLFRLSRFPLVLLGVDDPFDIP